MGVRFRVGTLFGLGILLADRLVKIYILNNFALGEVRPFIPGLMQLTYFQNTGMAFGFLGEHQWVPILLVPILVAVLLALIWKYEWLPCPVCQFALVGMIAGGIGNWIDRLAYGFVVDMFEFTFVRFAIFNVADIFITLGGVVLVVAYMASEWRTARAKRKEEGSSGE